MQGHRTLQGCRGCPKHGRRAAGGAAGSRGSFMQQLHLSERTGGGRIPGCIEIAMNRDMALLNTGLMPCHDQWVFP